MASKNDITNNLIQSRMNSKEFEENFDRIFRKKQSIEKHLTDSIKENEELYKNLDPLTKPFPHNILKQSRIDTIGSNGNTGDHYEYELNKSTGDIEKRFIDGVSKPNGEQFGNKSDSTES